MSRALRLLSLLLFWILPASVLDAGTRGYQFNEEKSRVNFNLTHLGLTTTSGHFENFDGLYYFDPEHIENAHVHLRIQSGSVTSSNPMIPELMRSEKFFWSEKFPEITFLSKHVERLSDKDFNIHGDLTIRGKTHPAVFKTELIKKESSRGHLFFHTHTFIRRKDYGIGVKNWLNPVMMAMHESLKISLDVEGIPLLSSDTEHL